MALVSLVASHHNRDLAVLDQLSVGAETLGKLVVGGSSVVSGAVVLPTCNRFEVYVETTDVDAARACVIDALGELTGLARPVIDAALETLVGDDASYHLLSVAAGLDSMVVGEREISGQVRRAHAEARDGQYISTRLDRLFQTALRTARMVATSTGLGRSGRTVVSVALDLAQETVTWSTAQVLMIGTGALAESSIGSIRGRGATIRGVYSPSGRASALASKYGIDAVTSEELPTALREADLVVACSGGENLVLTAPMVAAARHGVNKPCTIVDLALHRDVGPGVEDLRGVTVISLETVSAHAPEESAGAVEAARSIVAHAVARFDDESRSLDPAVVALREHVFGLLEREISRVRPAPGADPAAIERADAAEAALRHFAKTLLHLPTARARELASSGHSDAYLNAVRTLYGIDVAVPDGACPASEL